MIRALIRLLSERACGTRTMEHHGNRTMVTTYHGNHPSNPPSYRIVTGVYHCLTSGVRITVIRFLSQTACGHPFQLLIVINQTLLSEPVFSSIVMVE